ncbi:MAG: hypothetical protein JSS75_08765 [Bacteroidetes bacterium]|nr:hypothetical protein [Bacteroidota bacterium]
MRRLHSISSVVVLALLALTLAGSSTAFAQRAKNSIAVGAAFAGLPTLVQAQYETRIGDDQSIVGRFIYGLNTNDYSGYGLGAAYRFYLTDDQPVKGLSVGPALEVLFYSNSKLVRSSRILMIGAEGAYKLMLGQFSIEPALSFRIGVSGGESLSKFTSTLIYPAVYLGYAW